MADPTTIDLRPLVEAQEKGLQFLQGTIKEGLSPLGQLVAKFNEPKPEVAKLKEPAGIMEGITGFQVWDIPVGQVLVGGSIAVFATELLDGFLGKQRVEIRGLIKLVGAGASVKYLSKPLGGAASQALALLLAYDGLRDIVPFDTFVKGITAKISGVLPKRGLTQGNREALNEAESIVSGQGYYEKKGVL